MVKRILLFVLMLLFLPLAGCQSHEEELMQECRIEKGMIYSDLYDKYSDRLLAHDFKGLAWKNDDGTCSVAIFANGNEVSAFARFSPNRSVVESCGIRLVSIAEPERFYGKSESEFMVEYGQPHIDHGNGRYIPMYISQNGKLYYPMLRSEGAIIEGITELDLVTETSRFFDGSKWTTNKSKTWDGFHTP